MSIWEGRWWDPAKKSSPLPLSRCPCPMRPAHTHGCTNVNYLHPPRRPHTHTHTHFNAESLTFLASNTQRLFPSSSIWFHQRRPTSSLPVTFWNPGQDIGSDQRGNKKKVLEFITRRERHERHSRISCWLGWHLTLTDQKSKESRVRISTKHEEKLSLIQSQSK